MRSPALCLLFLVFAASIFFVYLTRAAIIQQRPYLVNHEPIESSTNETSNDVIIRKTTSTDNLNYPRLFTRKFIILTTGDHIKLYPFVDDHNGTYDSSDSSFVNFTLSQTHYLIKPKELEIDGLDPSRPFTRWLRRRSYKREHLNQNQASILPSEETGTDEDEYGGETGYQKPLISDVDYFLNREFCLNNRELKDDDCLVIIWLDKSNDLVRYGSMNLIQSPIEFVSNINKSNLTSIKTKVLWLDEFTPIDINESKDQDCLNHIISMVVDKQRHTLHLATSFFCGQDYTIRSIKFVPSRAPYYCSPLKDQQVLQFNVCPRNVASHWIDESTFDDFNLDEENGDWLFYLDKTHGSKIFALNTYNKWSSIDCDPRVPKTLHALVMDIPYVSRKFYSEESEAIAMTMDSKRRRLYWITETNQLYSSDYSGKAILHKGILPTKPSIRAPYSFQVIQNTLLISDSAKKSLVAYKMDNSHMWEHSYAILPYEVLLVEMPTLYGFRVVNLDNPLTTPSMDYANSRQKSREKSDKVIRELVEGKNLLTLLKAIMAELFLHSGHEDVYDTLMDRSYIHLYCGYLQSYELKRTSSTILWSVLMCMSTLSLILRYYFYCYRSTPSGEKVETKDIQSNV